MDWMKKLGNEGVHELNRTHPEGVADPLAFDLSRGDEATDGDFPQITEAELDEMDRELEEDLRLGRTVEASVFFAELKARHKLAG